MFPIGVVVEKTLSPSYIYVIFRVSVGASHGNVGLLLISPPYKYWVKIVSHQTSCNYLRNFNKKIFVTYQKKSISERIMSSPTNHTHRLAPVHTHTHAHTKVIWGQEHTIISESGILTFVSIISVLLALLRSIYNP